MARRRGKLSEREYVRSCTVEEDRGHATPCWIWRLSCDAKGYGYCTYPDGRKTRAHRVAYIAFVGPIADGLHVDHLCRVRGCCNPNHLEPVTPEENFRRSIPYLKGGRGGKPKTHCDCGAELTPDVRAKGRRAKCKPCWAAYMREWGRRNPRPLTGERRARKLEYMRLRRLERKLAAPGETGAGKHGIKPGAAVGHADVRTEAIARSHGERF